MGPEFIHNVVAKLPVSGPVLGAIGSCTVTRPLPQV